MTHLGIGNLIRFIVGIVLVQAATGVQVYAALQTEKPLLWAIFAGLTLVVGLLAALWFSSMLRHARKDAVDDLKENYLRERENIRIRAEREKTRVIKQSHKEMIKERQRTQSQASMKVGASFAGMIGIGALMMFTQFVTFGMMLMGTAGGALAGYAYRARQEFKDKDAKPGKLPGAQSIKRLGAESASRISQAVLGNSDKNNK